MKASQRWLLIFKAYHPVTGRLAYFADKNLPFGHSISCHLFQMVSDSLKHILEVTTGKKFHNVNYLDDFLFLDVTEEFCSQLVSEFLSICDFIKFPVSLEKTQWGSLRIEFLGMMLDGENKIIAVPQDKKDRAINMLWYFQDKKKSTVNDLQCLAGFW